MAIKADRQVDAVELRYFLNETAAKGNVLVVSTAGSGVAMDSTSNLATVAANSSGTKPLGILLNEFVNVDQTRYPLNWHKDQHQQGDKCTILTKGWVVTNRITGSPSAGQWAVLSSSGTVTGVAPHANTNEVANPFIGRFRTSIDEAGYATVEVDL